MKKPPKSPWAGLLNLETLWGNKLLYFYGKDQYDGLNKSATAVLDKKQVKILIRYLQKVEKYMSL